MSWFRLDDKVSFHAKVLRAGNEAFGAWARAGAWSCEHGTDGYIPADVAHLIAPPKVWKRAVESRVRPDGEGLARPVDGGYQIHDFLDFNPSAAAVESDRRAKSEAKARAGALGGTRSGEARRAAAAAPGGPDDRSKREAETKQPRSRTEPPANEAGEAKPKQNEAPSRTHPVPIPIPEIPPTGGSPRADAREAPAPAEPAGDPLDGEAEARAIFDALGGSPNLVGADTVAFARQLASHTNTGGNMGRVGLDDVLFAIRQAASKEGARLTAAGELPKSPGELCKFVVGCVQRVRRGEAAEDERRTGAGPQPRAQAVQRGPADHATWAENSERLYGHDDGRKDTF